VALYAAIAWLVQREEVEAVKEDLLPFEEAVRANHHVRPGLADASVQEPMVSSGWLFLFFRHFRCKNGHCWAVMTSWQSASVSWRHHTVP